MEINGKVSCDLSIEIAVSSQNSVGESRGESFQS